MAGHAPAQSEAPDIQRWQECHPYLYGLDLMNHGYYWEAHEAWEGLWHAVGRGGMLGDFFKGLIKLAAAGVKAREGRPAGVTRHARRAEELFASVAQQMKTEATEASLAGEQRLLGLSIDELLSTARRVAEIPPHLPPREHVAPVEIVFDFVLVPHPIQSADGR